MSWSRKPNDGVAALRPMSVVQPTVELSGSCRSPKARCLPWDGTRDDGFRLEDFRKQSLIQPTAYQLRPPVGRI